MKPWVGEFAEALYQVVTVRISIALMPAVGVEDASRGQG